METVVILNTRGQSAIARIPREQFPGRNRLVAFSPGPDLAGGAPGAKPTWGH